MRKRIAIPVVGLLLVFALSVPRVYADQTFHTEQLPLMPVGGAAPLRQGFVVDVHANGPVIYAQERYVLVGAAPDTTYNVALSAYPDRACASTPVLTIPEAKIVTNSAGNGEAGYTFVPNPNLLPGIYNLQWHVTSGGAVVYQTACSAVALD